jgi:hypothetical protein
MCLCDRFLTGPGCLEVDKAVRVKILRAGAQQTLTLKVGQMPGERTAEALAATVDRPPWTRDSANTGVGPSASGDPSGRPWGGKCASLHFLLVHPLLNGVRLLHRIRAASSRVSYRCGGGRGTCR